MASKILVLIQPKTCASLAQNHKIALDAFVETKKIKPIPNEICLSHTTSNKYDRARNPITMTNWVLYSVFLSIKTRCI